MFDFLTKIFSGEVCGQTKCSICLINKCFKFTFFLTPLKGKCQHLIENYNGKPCFVLVNKLLWISYTLAFIFMAVCYIQFQDVKNKLMYSEDTSEKVDGLIALEELTFLFFFLMMFVTATCLYSKRLNFLNCVVDLMDDQNVTDIFGPPWDCMTDLRTRNKFSAILLSLMLVNMFFAIAYQPSSNIFVNICFVFTFLLNTLMVIQVFREISIIVRYRLRVDKFLMNALKNKTGKNDVCALGIEEESSNENLYNQLNAAKIYYLQFYECIEDHLNNFMGPNLILWCLSSVIMLVLDLYMMILLIERGIWHKNIIEELRIYVHIFAVIFCMQRGTSITNLSDDTLSFLFKYPISKLSEAEAYQVEMLIYTLSSQKPTIKASDIFTVGTKLLASISGTVVTYVLVALQFRPAWSD